MIIVKIIKRDGTINNFEVDKIKNAISKACQEIGKDMSDSEILNIVMNVVSNINSYMEENKLTEINVEQIQDFVEKNLSDYKDILIAYKNYRRERNRIRDTKTDIMKTVKAIGVETDRDNANVGNNFSAKLLRIASESNKWTQTSSVIPKEMAKLHENGDLYFHDLDSYNLTTNCLHVPTRKMLTEGFNTGYGTIKRPQRIESAAELSCILLQASQNDCFGGQSHPNFDNDMGLFVEPTRQEIKNEYLSLGIDNDEKVEEKVEKRIHQAMQAVVYNLNSMHSRAGSQVPFSSVNIGIPESKDAALVCKVFLEEYNKGLGNGEQPIFPNIIFRVKDGVNAKEGDPYYYLYELACKVAAKHMNPTFMNINADFNKEYYDKGYIPATMG